jgi:hypothetical protein
MLRDELELYSKLTGKDGTHTPICVIGAYLDGYEKGRNESRWIPVSERLPEEDKVFIVTDNFGLLTFAWYTKDLYLFSHFDFPEYNEKHKSGWIEWNDKYQRWERVIVVAWMPLPTPHESEGE